MKVRDGSAKFRVISGVPASSHNGFGLIEVLIALLILAIGLLGMASLQTNGLKMTTGALSRSQAVLLADDLIERARANKENIDDYAVAAGIPPACDQTTAFNSANATAAEDVAEWRNSLSCLLPGGNAVVLVSGSVLTVTVSWDDRSVEATDGSIQVEAGI